MLSDILSFLRFVTDSDTRSTLASLSRLASPTNKTWKDNIKTATAKFSGEEPYKVNAFAKFLLDELKSIGIPDEKIQEFEIVFTELINNAFEHGCKHLKNSQVSIRCNYSRWFIRLEVEDSGRGFDFERKLAQGDQYGLQIVNKLAYKFKANKKGNILTTFLMSHDTIKILPTVKKYKGHEILIVNITGETEWNYMVTNWEPLRNIVKHSPQHLALIDCTKIRWISKTGREVKRIAVEFKEQSGKSYALVIEPIAEKAFDLSKLNSERFKVFFDEDTENAIQWLYEQARKYR